MRVLGIVCSPRRRGNTEIMMREALASAEEAGAEVELVTVAGKDIGPCDGCDSCLKTTKCRIEDDMQELYAKLLAAHGIIFGTPVYFWSVTAQAKAIMDRTHVLYQGRRLRNKVAGAVVVTGRSGVSGTFSLFQSFFALHGMISTAGAIGYGREEEIGPGDRGGGAVAYAEKKGEVRRDKRGMAEARTLGRAMVRCMQLCRESDPIGPVRV